MKRYSLLLIDADGTILDFAAAEQKALYAACHAMGLTIDDAQAAQYRRINDDLWRAFERGEVTQEALRSLRFERFLHHIGSPQDPGVMSEAFVDALSLQTDEIDGARDFLAEAAARVPVIVVTNGIARVQRSRFARSPLSQHLFAHVISGEIGLAKPDPRMIEHALALKDAQPAQALMVGDEPRSDIAAANAAGVASCWYNPARRQNETGHLPTYEVRALHEVLQWL